MSFWSLQFLPKNERNHIAYCKKQSYLFFFGRIHKLTICFLKLTELLTLLQWNLRSACFCSFFWKKLKTPKRHFEINWPLVIPASCARLNESKYTSDTSEPTRTTRSFFDLIWGPWHFSKLQMPTSIYEKFQKSCQLFAFLEFWLY